ncbi:MAG: hypothetical protein A2340_12055 [Lentisphaerae bacterium RIFOXYB12_FULL_60_10]|nr:MAG: hypothetical protein A2340_12055 [Lentisphaerae bacterium RIFOXYB12_FULL_60_10]
MRGIRQGWILAGLTAIEIVRQPVCLLLTITAVAACLLSPLTLMHNFGEDGKLARDGGLAFHFLFGLFLAAQASATALHRELQSGTAAAILSKPVNRMVFFLAKCGGVAVVLVGFSAAVTMATLLATRTAEVFLMTRQYVGYVMDWRTGIMALAAIPAAVATAARLNYRTRRSFTSSAFVMLLVYLACVVVYALLMDRHGRFAPLASPLEWRILGVSYLVLLALLILSVFTVTVSTRLPAGPTLLAASALVIAGLVSDYLFGSRLSSPAFARLGYAIIPNWQNFWMADALNAGGRISYPYLAGATVYAACMITALLGIGLLTFERTETR